MELLKGTVCLSRGWLNDAYSYYEKAVRIEPSNREYQAAFNQMKIKETVRCMEILIIRDRITLIRQIVCVMPASFNLCRLPVRLHMNKVSYRVALGGVVSSLCIFPCF